MPFDDPPRVVRRPRYVPFLVTGFLLGVAATIAVLLLGDDVEEPRRLAVYLGILLGGLGALGGGALAVWWERDGH